MEETETPSTNAAPITQDEPKRSVLEWQRLKATPAWLFAGAAAGNRWSTAPEVEPTSTTEADYDAAIVRAGGRQ